MDLKSRQERAVANNIATMFPKKQCVANVIIDGEKVLLLKRSVHDSFHGGTWCLPGGGKDVVESPFNACVRETFEEAGLTHRKDYFIMGEPFVADLPDVTIYYFISTVHRCDLKEIRLSEAEHQQYVWVNEEEWLDMNLILDLKSHLCQLFNVK